MPIDTGLRRVARPHSRPRGEGRGEVPAPLARVLEEHEPLVRRGPRGAQAHRAARRLPGRSATRCWSGRRKKLFSLQPVVELGWRYGRWHREAGRAEEAGRELLGNDRYAAHLAALGGRATIERAVERIEHAAVLDHLPARVVAACETLDDRVRGDRPAPLLPAGARESLRPAVLQRPSPPASGTTRRRHS